MKVIGITGGVGAGKSEMLSYIGRHYKCKILKADDIAKEIQLPGGICYERMVQLLGQDVLDENKVICKEKMAEKIFYDPSLLKKVNAIVHPGVRAYLEEAKAKETAAGETELLFVEAALLIENGYKDFVDEMWYVYADEEVRKKRLAGSRGYSEEKARRIMDSQLKDEEFRKMRIL